jgi:hypothetical protein
MTNNEKEDLSNYITAMQKSINDKITQLEEMRKNKVKVQLQQELLSDIFRRQRVLGKLKRGKNA